MQIRRKLNLIRNIVYIIVILISLTCLMFLYYDYSAQIPLKLILSVMIIQFVVFQICARRMRIFLVSSSEISIYRNGTAELALFINKRSIFPFKKAEVVIKYKSRYEDKYRKKKISVDLKDGLKQWEPFEISGLSCGYTDFAIENIFLYDVFAFTSIRLKCRYNPLSLIIVPEIKPAIINMSEIRHVSVDEFETFEDDHKGNSNEELYDIREFRDGDSLNRIHWKLSSKQEEIMVRESVSPVETNIYVFFDLSKSVNINKMFEEAVSVCHALLNTGYPFYIAWLQKDGSRNIFKRSLVTKYEQIQENLLKLMEYPLYEYDAETKCMLQKFMNERKEIYNLFVI